MATAFETNPFILMAKHRYRRVRIDCCKDGTISYRLKCETPLNGVALEVFSVNTISEAIQLQTATCRLMYEDHPNMKAKERGWFKLASGPFVDGFTGEIDDLPRVSEYFAEVYERIRRRAKGRN